MVSSSSSTVAAALGLTTLLLGAGAAPAASRCQQCPDILCLDGFEPFRPDGECCPACRPIPPSCEETSICPMILDPVCVTLMSVGGPITREFNNPCLATACGFSERDWVAGSCTDRPPPPPTPTPDHPRPCEDAICPMILDPVCVTFVSVDVPVTREFNNPCLAAACGFSERDWVTGSCTDRLPPLPMLDRQRPCEEVICAHVQCERGLELAVSEGECCPVCLGASVDGDDDVDRTDDAEVAECSEGCADRFLRCVANQARRRGKTVAWAFDTCRRKLDLQQGGLGRVCDADCAATDQMLAVLE